MGAQEMDWHDRCLGNVGLLMLGVVQNGGFKKIKTLNFVEPI